MDWKKIGENNEFVFENGRIYYMIYPEDYVRCMSIKDTPYRFYNPEERRAVEIDWRMGAIGRVYSFKAKEYNNPDIDALSENLEKMLVFETHLTGEQFDEIYEIAIEWGGKRGEFHKCNMEMKEKLRSVRVDLGY